MAVVVFNRALVPYLTRLIDEPAVTVATLGRFTHRHGYRIDFAGGAAAAAVLARQREQGIRPTVDALLVDEVQDMDPAWLHLLLDLLRPGRGSAMFVGDPAQSLYRTYDLGKVKAISSPVVVLVGIDLLPEEDEVEEANANCNPVALVGAARATDLLLIVHTRETARLRALRAQTSPIRCSTWAATPE